MLRQRYYTGRLEWWECKERQEGLDQEQSTEDYIQALYRNGYHLRDQAGIKLNIDDVIHPANKV